MTSTRIYWDGTGLIRSFVPYSLDECWCDDCHEYETAATPALCGALYAERLDPDGEPDGDPVLLGHVNTPPVGRSILLKYLALETDHRWLRWRGELYLLWKRLPEDPALLEKSQFLSTGAETTLSRIECADL